MRLFVLFDLLTCAAAGQIGCDMSTGSTVTWRACSSRGASMAAVAVILCRNNRSEWQALMKRGMERDFTWNKAAEQYEQIFEWAKIDMPYCG